MTEYTPDPELVSAVREWLGEAGISFFRQNLSNHGTVSPVLKDGPIPHPVHFREGMRVRNKMRELTNYEWTDHEYDDRWKTVIEHAIAED